MRKHLAFVLVLVLVVGALGAPAIAKKKKKKKPRPVETVMYMHGPSQFGEVDGAQWFVENLGPGMSPLTMDVEEPAGGQPKSMNYFSPALNDQCTGLPVAFPTFNGDMTGKIKGDATLTLNFLSVPASGALARIWADIPPFSACNDDYIEPASEVEFDVPAGQNEVEVVFEDLNLNVQSFILVEILVPSGSDYRGQVGRLLYDSPDAATSITFDCLPAKGKKVCAE